MMYKIFLILLFSVRSISSDYVVEVGEEWMLEARSSKLSPTNSKVLYLMPSDAYHTYNARKFGDWDTFSIVDSRDLERLNKGDVIEIVGLSISFLLSFTESKEIIIYNEKIYKVRLLNNKSSINKNFYVISEDLIEFFKPLKEIKND